mmetsp:Transcript_99080/g.289045  ORF Transcript_99080/g.289045 Transcript_99080/m.289045 type:complete len:580 (-) Transcript_99080:84-1823(-)
MCLTALGGMWRGILVVVVVAVVAAPTVWHSPQATKAGPMPGQKESGSEETTPARVSPVGNVLKSREGAQDSCEEGMTHFAHSFLQTEMQISRQAHTSFQEHRQCTRRAPGIELILLYTVPFAVMQVAACSLLALWLSRGRVMLSDHVFEQAPKPGHPGASNPVEQDRKPPPMVAVFANAGIFLVNVIFSSMIISGVEHTVAEAGGGQLLSSIADGACALGSILCFPLAVHFSRCSYRAAIVFLAVVAVLGNLIYAVLPLLRGPWAILGIIAARIFSCMGGSLNVVFFNMVLQLSSGTCLVSSVGNLLLYSSLGLVLGPSASSLSSLCLPWMSTELSDAVLMIFAVSLYGICGAVWLPRRDACPEPAAESEAAPSELQLRAAWLSLGLQIVVQLNSFVQQVSWEAGALLLLVHEYHITEQRAALLVAIPVLAGIPLSFCVGRLYETLGPDVLMRALTVLELFGLLLMLRPHAPSPAYLGIYLVGSSVYYAANWVSSAPFSPLRKKHAHKGHWLLNLETTTSLIWVFNLVAYFYGPALARAALHTCMHQNMLVFTQIIFWIGSMIAIEIATQALSACEAGV